MNCLTLVILVSVLPPGFGSDEALPRNKVGAEPPLEHSNAEHWNQEESIGTRKNQEEGFGEYWNEFFYTWKIS